MTLSFAVSAAIGALAGVLVTPITLTSFDIGMTMALKGFAAAMLGGMGNPKGAWVGGIVLGLLESLTAGYISSQYKEAAACVVILAVVFFMSQGMFGARTSAEWVYPWTFHLVLSPLLCCYCWLSSPLCFFPPLTISGSVHWY